MTPADPASPTPPQDLGFGDRVVRESRKRLLNRDGTFNVRREGLGFFGSWTMYEYLVTVGWPRYLLLVGAAYAIVNALFAFAFWLCGPSAISGPETHPGALSQYVQAYFFSVQTLATIGYGHLSPRGLVPNAIVAFESLIGLLGLALITGLAFARFARPAVGIRFSDQAVLAPYFGGQGLMFRVVNTHQSELVNARVQVMLARWKTPAKEAREFIPITLERDSIVFFPLTWTIVHPITDSSPLRGLDGETLHLWDAEFLVLLSALDETSYQTMHARTSYKAAEIVFGARFKSILGQGEDGMFRVDVRALSEIENVPAAAVSSGRIPDAPGAGTRDRP